MAATLTPAALLLVQLRDRLTRLTPSPGWQGWGQRVAAALPVLTALFVVVVGGWPRHPRAHRMI